MTGKHDMEHGNDNKHHRKEDEPHGKSTRGNKHGSIAGGQDPMERNTGGDNLKQDHKGSMSRSRNDH